MKPTSDTRYSLIAKLNDACDTEAWAEFVQIYQPVIFQIVSNRGLQYADATDVTQQVLARVAQSVSKFDPDRHGATFRGWLYRITQNLTIDFLRKGKRNAAKTFASQSAMDWASVPQPHEDDSQEFRDCFEQRLLVLASQVVKCRVAEKTWQAFWQTEIEQRAVSDVADSLGMTEGAVYVARSRVIASLKKEVQRRMNETGLHSPD